MKKKILIILCVLISIFVVGFWIFSSTCSSIPWIHQLEYKLSQRRLEKKIDKRLSMLPGHVREKILEDDKYRASRDVTEAITAGIPDEVQRAVVAFRILGLENLMLAGGSAWVSSFSKILDGISMPARIKALMIVQDDPQALKAASWWLFKHLTLVGYDSAYERIAEEQLRIALPVATFYAMANWQRYETSMAIRILAKTQGQTAKGLLREILSGTIIVNESKPGSEMYLRGMSAERRCSTKALAGLALAQSGDMESLEQIRELSEISEGDDKIVFKKALAILTENAEKR